MPRGRGDLPRPPVRKMGVTSVLSQGDVMLTDATAHTRAEMRAWSPRPPQWG